MIPWSIIVFKAGAYNILRQTWNANRRSFITWHTSISTTRVACITSKPIVQKAYMHGEDFNVTGRDVYTTHNPYVAKWMTSTACSSKPHVHKTPLQNRTRLQRNIVATSTLMIPWSKQVSKTGAYNILPEPWDANRRSFITRHTSISTTRAACIPSKPIVQKAYIHGEDFNVTGRDVYST